MRILIRDQYDVEVLTTQTDIYFLNEQGESCLTVEIKRESEKIDIFEVKIPEKDSENAKSDLLTRGYLDARKYPTKCLV